MVSEESYSQSDLFGTETHVVVTFVVVFYN